MQAHKAHNRGLICLGTSGDTPAFAADAGGSNGCRIRASKERLKVRVCDRFGLTVTVSHDPTGCSKWNPVGHRLFSQISRNWAGVQIQGRPYGRVYDPAPK